MVTASVFSTKYLLLQYVSQIQSYWREVVNASVSSTLSPKGAVELKSSCHTGLDPNS
jgi:hypothetical protein